MPVIVNRLDRGNVSDLKNHFEYWVAKTGRLPNLEDGCVGCGERACERWCKGMTEGRKSMLAHYPGEMLVNGNFVTWATGKWQGVYLPKQYRIV